MTLRALILGSVGTIVESSDLQRRSYNRAFEDCGVPWEWSTEEYRRLLRISGGLRRLRDYAGTRGADSAMDDDTLKRVHRLKTEYTQSALLYGSIRPRAGVVRIVREARAAGLRLAVATTTEPVTVDSILTRMAPDWGARPFEVVVDRTQVQRDKPAPDVYERCLAVLGIDAREALAIEDTPESLESAAAAGVACVATPGAYHAHREFPGAAAVLTSLGDPGCGAKAVAAPVPLASDVVSVDWLRDVHAAGTGASSPQVQE